jgi:hypothetical protein
MAMPCATRNPLFLGRWLQDEVIIVAVRWYLAYPLGYRQVCDMLRNRGVSVAPSTVMRLVLRYAPEFEKRWQGYDKPVALGWRVDETYIQVGGHWTYLCWAVDQNGKKSDGPKELFNRYKLWHPYHDARSPFDFCTRTPGGTCMGRRGCSRPCSASDNQPSLHRATHDLVFSPQMQHYREFPL